MKQAICYIILLIGLMIAPLEATSTRVNDVDHTFYLRVETLVVLDALTIYNPTVGQCDRTPLITSSNSKINVDKLHGQQIRWMALSRDLLSRWQGEFHYGDTVLVTTGDATIDGLWIIKDTMNKRYKNHGDLLFDSRIRKSGKWFNVEISRVKWVAI